MATPKQEFLDQKPLANQHQELVDTAAFAAGSQYALLQLIAEIPDTLDPTAAAAYYHQITGARRYLGFVKTIGLPAMTVPRRKDTDNLPIKP